MAIKSHQNTWNLPCNFSPESKTINTMFEVRSLAIRRPSIFFQSTPDGRRCLRARSDLRLDDFQYGCNHSWQSDVDPLSRHLVKQKEILYTRELNLGNLNLRRVYRRRDYGAVKSTLHWGQRKLLLSEIEFLANHSWQTSRKSVVVYAGAAPGDHLPLLIGLFRGKIQAWELFDPREMSWSDPLEDVNVHAQRLDEQSISMLVIKYHKWDILLISDIRSADYTNLSPDENDSQILQDMRLQEKWVHDLSVKNASLKFRLPYDSKRFRELTYIGGRINLPVWGPQSTTECRLITNAHEKSKVYNVLDYNERMYYFNTVHRSSKYTICNDTEWPLSGSAHGNCYDCITESIVLSNFVMARTGLKLSNIDIKNMASGLRAAITDCLQTSDRSHLMQKCNHLLLNLKCLTSLQCVPKTNEFQEDEIQTRSMELLGLPHCFKAKKGKY